MAGNTSEDEMLREADIRLCKICIWTNYDGFGFKIRSNSKNQYIINMIESNSPASTSGLKLMDIIVAVNQISIIESKYDEVHRLIKRERDANSGIELLVVKQHYNKNLKLNHILNKSKFWKVISGPSIMPVDFANFPKNTPRICYMRLGRNDIGFGFEIVIGDHDVGAYMQTIDDNSPASDAGLRQFDRIIEINDRNVEHDSGKYIQKKMNKATKKGIITLFVADTHTYEYYINNKMKFDSKKYSQKINDTMSASSSTVKPISNNNTTLPSRIPCRVVTEQATIANKSNTMINRDIKPTRTRRLSQIFSPLDESRSNEQYTSTFSVHSLDVKCNNEFKRQSSSDSLYQSEEVPYQRDNTTFKQSPIVERNQNKTSTVKYHSMIDLRKTIPNPVIKIDDVSNGRIQLYRGDIIDYTVDVIVIASTSDNLRKSILQAAGQAVTTSYNTQNQQRKDVSIYTDGGNLLCKRIYFIPCSKLSYKADRWVFRKFINEAIQMANNDPATIIRSIAFPAIGCGRLSYDANFVAKTLILAVAYEFEHQSKLRLDVSFIIQQTTVLDAFQTEFTAFKNNKITFRPQSPRIGQHSFTLEKRLVSKSNKEYNRIVEQFNTTMTKLQYSEIIRIELVWNERWYKQYQIHKAEFSQRLKTDTEQALFHGCCENSANGIMEKGFDRSYAGRHGVSYGYGVYFSSTAKYSHSYATPNSKGERCMFLAKVLIGRTIRGNSTMKVCPIGYDTTTNGSNIYVIYHDTQAFGNYLITYK